MDTTGYAFAGSIPTNSLSKRKEFKMIIEIKWIHYSSSKVLTKHFKSPYTAKKFISKITKAGYGRCVSYIENPHNPQHDLILALDSAIKNKKHELEIPALPKDYDLAEFLTLYFSDKKPKRAVAYSVSERKIYFPLAGEGNIIKNNIKEEQ
jgi:hypothetical protein